VVATLADAVAGAEALVVGVVDGGVSPPHAAVRPNAAPAAEQTRRARKELRMGAHVTDLMREIKAGSLG